MFRLIRMEIKRLLYSKSFYITLLGFVITIAFGIASANGHKGDITLNQIVGNTNSTYPLLVIFLAIFISAYIHLDFHCGQIKNIVTATKDRGSFISIKFTSIAALILLCFVICILTVIGFSACSPTVSLVVGNVFDALLSLAQMYVMYLFLLSLYMLYSVLFKKELICIVLSLITGFGLPVGEDFLGSYIHVNLEKGSVLCHLFEFDGSGSVGTKVLYLVLALVYTAIAIGICKLIMRKRDIHI